MNAAVQFEPRARRIEAPSRGGAFAALDFGPEDRPVDVVFSHANGFNARTYRTILAPLAAELRILALDARGHGATELPADPENWEGWGGYAADLLAALGAATDRPVVLAGHSMGATSSLLAAAEAPEQVRSLVLFEPVLIEGIAQRAPGWDQPSAQAARRRRAAFPDLQTAFEAYRGRGAFATWTDAQLADYVAAGFRAAEGGGVTLACAPAWEASNFAVHNYDPWPLLEAPPRPLRIVRADEESHANGGDRLLALAARGGFELEVVPDTTHFLPMERPDLVREALREAARAS